MKILVAGMRRSGSTWLYNVVRLAMRGAELVKLHEPADPQADVILTSRRDLRDIAASAVRWGQCSPEGSIKYVQQEVANHAYWRERTALEIVYEDDAVVKASKVLKLLGLDVDAKAICAEVDALPIRQEEGYDPVTLIWKGHRTGATRDALPLRVLAEIEYRFGEWLERYGYTIDTGMGYYSQHGEDEYLTRFFGDGGFFVEVGASDGVNISNSLHFEQRGWQGICIEPVPELYQKLKANRKCICLNCAVGLEVLGGHELFAGHGEKHEVVPDGSSALFFVHKGGNKDISGFTRSDNQDYFPIVVKQRTLTAIFEEYGVKDVDILSVDTEGTEVDVLRSLDFKRWKPKVIIAEFATVHYGDTSEKLAAYLRQVGYVETQRMGGNIIAVDASRQDILTTH